MTVVRFKNLNVGRSRPSNKFQAHSIGNENLGYNKDDTWLSILARTCPRKSVVRQWIPRVKARRRRQRPYVRALRRPAAWLYSDDATLEALPGVDIGDCATSRRSAQKDARRRGQALKAP